MLKIDKGWGNEVIWADTETYCGKFLNFHEGGTFSMHFHAKKDETWYVSKGKFKLKTLDTKYAEVSETELIEGDTWRNQPLQPHQLICIEQGTIIEVSTKDDYEDNYRIFPGDSQK